ncbi:Fc.00g035640.m01.CDS01 [Cosmosporella sp. VM-42]
MGTDIASRLRAKFSKRRHSATAPSLNSNPSGSATDSWSLRSHHRDRDRDHSSVRAVSQTRGSTPHPPSQTGDDRESQSRRESGSHYEDGESSVKDDRLSITADKGDSAQRDTAETLQTRPVAPSLAAETPVSPVSPAAVPPSPPHVPASTVVEQLHHSRGLAGTTVTNESNDAPGNDLQPSPPHSPSLSTKPLPSHLDSINEDSSAERSPSPTAQSDAGDHGHDQVTFILAPTTSSATTFAPGLPTPSGQTPRPPGPPRRQSLLSNRQTTLIKTLLHNPHANEYGADPSVLPIDAEMVTRKIWVKRPHASPTLITVNEDDLVDDVRDMILRKYANSLGRTFDSPDLNIRIMPRDQHKDRFLGPEEPMGRTLDAYYPGGQTVDEALIIDIPRRAPKASPRPPQPHAHGVYYNEDGRPSETGEGYFPPVGGVPSPHLPVTVPAQTNVSGPHSIAVLGTGHIPPIPSPGGTRSRAYRERPDRPRLGRTHTSSPTIIANGVPGSIAATANHGTQHFNPRLPRSRTHSNSSSDPSGMPPTAPPIPTPPAPEPSQTRVATPPPRISSPRPSSSRPKKIKKNEHPNLPPGMLNGSVPPINVLIVEDNPINLKLLEAFVKRLKVRWQTAMNGRDAVKKWRTGGFHLVLMDIQLPIMNGLDATREIRRLEKVNSIGVFSSTPSSSVQEEASDELQEGDKLENPTLFKSPVIIVALTASSLQSDRHEALAAGCNDFLTKPVNFVWLERKVMEWGCMQALIDFDGWRRWKDFSQKAEENEAIKKAAAAKVKAKKNRVSMTATGA